MPQMMTVSGFGWVASGPKHACNRMASGLGSTLVTFISQLVMCCLPSQAECLFGSPGAFCLKEKCKTDMDSL